MANAQVTGSFTAATLSYSAPSGFSAWDEGGTGATVFESLLDALSASAAGVAGVAARNALAEAIAFTAAYGGQFPELLADAFTGDDTIVAAQLLASELVETLEISTDTALLVAVLVREQVAFADTIAELTAHLLAERVAVQEQLSSNASQQRVLTDALALRASARLTWLTTLADALTLAESAGVKGQAALAVAEAIALAETFAATLFGTGVVEEGFALSDTLLRHFAVLAAETLDISGTANAREHASALLTVVAGLTAAPRASARIPLLVGAGVGVDDALASGQLANLLAEERISFGGVLMLPEGEYTAWVVNTRTLAPSEYRSFPFNSFAAAGGSAYGATEEGIYELEGSTDAGEPIVAAVRTGLMDFASAAQKALPEVFIAYTASGLLGLKVITTDAGVRRESWYRLAPVHGAPDTSRVQPGKGLRARYWALELTNIDGAEFEVSDLKLHPIVLSRRI